MNQNKQSYNSKTLQEYQSFRAWVQKRGGRPEHSRKKESIARGVTKNTEEASEQVEEVRAAWIASEQGRFVYGTRESAY
jgi:hypothetical protein